MELYVAGVLTDAELAQVDDMIQKHPELQVEIQAIIDATILYTELHTVAINKDKTLENIKNAIQNLPAPEENNPKIKNGMFSKNNNAVKEDNLFTNKEGKNAEVKKLPNDGRPQNTPINRVLTDAQPGRPIAISQTKSYGWLAASIIFLLLSLGLNGFLYIEWDKQKATIVSLEQSIEKKGLEYQALNTKYSNTQGVMDIFTNKEFKQLQISGNDTMNSEMLATVYWNRKTQDVRIMPQSIAKLPTGKVYQLWAINNEGKPVDAGVLDMKDDIGTMQQMKLVADAKAFAVTIEPDGGSESPTMPIVMQASL